MDDRLLEDQTAVEGVDDHFLGGQIVAEGVHDHLLEGVNDHFLGGQTGAEGVDDRFLEGQTGDEGLDDRPLEGQTVVEGLDDHLLEAVEGVDDGHIPCQNHVVADAVQLAAAWEEDRVAVKGLLAKLGQALKQNVADEMALDLAQMAFQLLA